MSRVKLKFYQNRKKRSEIIGVLVIIVILLVIPAFLGPYGLRYLADMFMFASLAVSWNLLAGFTGYISFGHAFFFGIGAYATAVAMVKLHLPFFVGMLGGGLISVFLAIVIGLPILRLKGHYFALVTFGIAELLRGIVNNLPGITGGGMGLNIPALPWKISAASSFFYYTMFGLLVIIFLVNYIIINSKLGYGLITIRENEESSAITGVDTRKYKVISFSLSGLFTSMVGSVYVYWITILDSSDIFELSRSLTVITIVLLGGLGNLFGPIWGTILFFPLSELVWGKFLFFHSLILGLIMIVIIIFIPKGLSEILKDWRKLSIDYFVNNLRNFRV